MWRTKRKHTLTSLASYDLDGDGVNEVVTGWSNGRVDVRSDQTGEVIYSDVLDSAIQGVAVADFRLTGVDELLAVTQSGEMRGYKP